MFRYAFYSSYFKFSINRRPKHPRYGIPGVPDIHIQLHMHIRLHLHIYIYTYIHTHIIHTQYLQCPNTNGDMGKMGSSSGWTLPFLQVVCLWDRMLPEPRAGASWDSACEDQHAAGVGGRLVVPWRNGSVLRESFLCVCVCGNQFWYVATIMGRWTSGCRRLCSCGILEMFTRYKALGACRDQHGPRPTADEPTILLN